MALLSSALVCVAFALLRYDMQCLASALLCVASLSNACLLALHCFALLRMAKTMRNATRGRERIVADVRQSDKGGGSQ